MPLYRLLTDLAFTRHHPGVASGLTAGVARGARLPARLLQQRPAATPTPPPSGTGLRHERVGPALLEMVQPDVQQLRPDLQAFGYEPSRRPDPSNRSTTW